jgi:hypothetical protein
VAGAAFAVFAAPGVAVKESAETAIAAATDSMEIVFMFGLPRMNGPRADEHARHVGECNLRKLNSALDAAGGSPRAPEYGFFKYAQTPVSIHGWLAPSIRHDWQSAGVAAKFSWKLDGKTEAEGAHGCDTCAHETIRQSYG